MTSKKRIAALAVVFGAAAYAGFFLYEQDDGQRTPAEQGSAAVQPVQARREALDFRMTDLERGWIRYADGASVTSDGGIRWQEAEPGEVDRLAAEGEAKYWKLREDKLPETVALNAKAYPVKKAQFATDRIGWALVGDAAGLKVPLLVTVDGGETWQAEVTPEAESAIREEKRLQARMERETALYASPERAQSALRSSWLLMPDSASPGDVVLVRSDREGEIVWQGKTYKLSPFGAGYFTYLPIPMQTKPGEYPIGDKQLTIVAKKFETQHLQVTKQMESMRQDTKRIQEDQKKIDLARSRSRPEFIGSAAFIQPVEGILTTPYGYTRYVNGKYDSSHMAIDLAAKEGTPIKAAGDGVVALADSLYLTGNSIYIDHGMGLFSQYAHLSELRVKAGDTVKQGDIIGLVGTTGFSTGPHLHFTFWAHNIQVNPNLFFGSAPFHWLK